MTQGEILSILINIAVGIYFAYFYPRSVKRRLGSGQLPPAFAMLIKFLPPIGYAIIVLSLAYAIAKPLQLIG